MSFKIVAVIGAGQMGQGIAQVFATAGYQVILHDIDGAAIEKGLATLKKSLSKLAEKDRLAETPDVISARIQGSTDFSALAAAGLVVEAATENEQLKHKIFAQLDKVCPSSTLLASNTSSISITRLAAVTQRPDKVIGLHFMNPVPLMKLIEVIKGLQTSEETYQSMLEVADKLNKTAVTSQDRPGFVVNRILMPMINEAIFTLYEGVASADEIDEAMKLGVAHPMGPLALADLIGLDTCLSIMQVLHDGFSDSKYRPCPLLKQMVDAGYLGRKTGRGFFQYN
ncbi:MAG: 3-hydroxybutyryl-CoA dehydrogenase [Oceanospirillaceae bacterium]